MQEVKQALETFATARRMDGGGEHDMELPDFTEVAVKWSAFCVRSLRGDLLTLGLDIAKSLSEFDRGLKFPETLRD